MPGKAPSPLERIAGLAGSNGMSVDGAAVRIASELGVPAAPLRGAASYYAHLSSPPGAQVCAGTSCFLCHGGEGPQDARPVYCLGHCDRSPAWLAEDGVAHGPDGPLASLPEIHCQARTPIVTRRLLAGGAATLERARELGAYASLTSTPGPAAVPDALERSGERGCGGPGFASARKWRTCAETPADRRYLIACGDEGDPGSFIDRVLMEHHPHAILDCMILGGHAIGAAEGINVGTMTRRTALAGLVGEDLVEIHPEDALRDGVADGATVHVESRWGTIDVKARHAPRVAPGTLFLTFHFPETHANRLTGPVLDPQSKCPQYKATAVRVLPL